jgi:hypothetical protein
MSPTAYCLFSAGLGCTAGVGRTSNKCTGTLAKLLMRAIGFQRLLMNRAATTLRILRCFEPLKIPFRSHQHFEFAWLRDPQLRLPIIRVRYPQCVGWAGISAIINYRDFRDNRPRRAQISPDCPVCPDHQEMTPGSGIRYRLKQAVHYFATRRLTFRVGCCRRICES